MNYAPSLVCLFSITHSVTVKLMDFPDLIHIAPKPVTNSGFGIQ
jgi:hypothetical protein